tara:strand:- start:666 stop:1292 length:627 start_codon:yes stop_codon:yes gene_type:complete
MNLIKTDFKCAVLETAKEIKQTKPYKFCLTGGNFGSFLLSELINRNYSPHKKNIFITDERLNCSKDYQNAESVLIGLRKLKNFQPFNFIPFLQTEDPDLSYRDIKERLGSHFLDFTVLSLGEDGHLAGHFVNSYFLKDDRFCFTDNALKEPKSRISFTVDFLSKSKKIVLAIFGEEKKSPLIELMEGTGTHSSIITNKNLTIYTDIKL